MKSLSFFEIIRLRLKNRYVRVTTNFLGFPFVMSDKSSFLYMYDEILKKEIYRFVSTNKFPKIIDCGANIGLSVIYFKQLYPESNIIAFEPDPIIFKILSDNIISSKLQGVTLINKGLSDSEGIINFFSEGADGGRIALEKDGEKIIKINTVKLGEFLDKNIDMLKIDIEGAELDVLNECKGKLNKVANLFVEYHSFRDKKQELDKLLNILTEAGFRYFIHSPIEIKTPFVKVLPYAGFDLQLNIFAYRLK